MPTPQKIRCRVDRLTAHGDHVYTVDLVPERRAPAFKPGQFLHLALDEYDPAGFWPESRVFSIASAPIHREHIRLLYSVRGRYTARMEQELTPDRGVWVKLPYGEFVVDPTRDVVLIAGGTGITAFAGFIEGLAPNHAQQVHLFYGARQASLLVYRETAASVASRVPAFRVTSFVEDAATADPAGSVLPGRLSVAEVWTRVPAPTTVVFYLSGPPAMLQALTQDLRQRGIAPESIRVDAWE